MTIEVFMTTYGIKKKNTVVNWISANLIPGAVLIDNYIPDSARPPYTQARAKTSDAIYYSIVKASRKKYHVLPQIYKICEEEFNGYINQLVKAHLIVIRISDNITYYDATITAKNYKRKFILDAIESCSRGVSEGTTAAILKHSAHL